MNKLGFPFWFETPTVHTPQRRLSWLFPATQAAVTSTTPTPEQRAFIEALGFKVAEHDDSEIVGNRI